jgi:hypothetical protein
METGSGVLIDWDYSAGVRYPSDLAVFGVDFTPSKSWTDGWTKVY